MRERAFARKEGHHEILEEDAAERHDGARFGRNGCANAGCRTNTNLSDVQPDIESNVKSNVDSDVDPDVKSNVDSDVDSDVKSDIESDELSGFRSDFESHVVSNVQSNFEPHFVSHLHSDELSGVEAHDESNGKLHQGGARPAQAPYDQSDVGKSGGTESVVESNGEPHSRRNDATRHPSPPCGSRGVSQVPLGEADNEAAERATAQAGAERIDGNAGTAAGTGHNAELQHWLFRQSQWSAAKCAGERQSTRNGSDAATAR